MLRFSFVACHILNRCGAGLGHPAETVDGRIHLSRFQPGMGRAPQAEIDDGTAPAALQKLPALGTHIPDLRHKLLPGLAERPLTQIAHCFRSPQGRAQAELAIITDVETPVPRPAMKEGITAGVRERFVYQFVAAVPQDGKACFVRPFQDDNFFRRQTFLPDLCIPLFIPVKAQMQLGIKAEIVLCPGAAEAVPTLKRACAWSEKLTSGTNSVETRTFLEIRIILLLLSQREPAAQVAWPELSHL